MAMNPPPSGGLTEKLVPDALSAEDWFRFHGWFANGDAIAASAKSN